MSEPTTSRWITEFDRQVKRRKHIILYGNIHDQFLCRDVYQSVHEFLTSYFADRGFEIVVRYDPVDGMEFGSRSRPGVQVNGDGLPSGMQERFAELVRRGVRARMGETPAATPSTPSAPADPTQPPSRGLPSRAMGGSQPRLLEPVDAFGELRLVTGQPVSSTAAIIDLGDMLTYDSSRFPADERPALMQLHKCMLEAATVRGGRSVGYRNTVVLLAADLRRVPEWLYRDNPYVALVRADHPSKEERRQFALQFLRPQPGMPASGFYGGDALVAAPAAGQDGPSLLEQVADEFADLTDGFQAIDLNSLRFTSWQHKVPVAPKQMHRLVDLFKFGLRDDPWEQLNADKVRTAEATLQRRVIGQPRAVEAVTSMLTSARVGIAMSGGNVTGRPKGVFFFVGPTGVGKTELAKAVTELVFGDERAFARFDMSEYKEEHAAEKLAGAPPGFVGYDEGGQLTNRVLEHPHSILLFDEIEKAHPKVLDKFLQILEDGRLTDGKGQTAYFHQTAIIFTSNIGSSDITDANGRVIRPGIMRAVQESGTDQFGYEKVARHFQEEVTWYFTSRIGRAELLNRFGDNVVPFDLLRPEFVAGIARKFLDLLAQSALNKHRLALGFDGSIVTAVSRWMSSGDNLLYGGRRIKSLLETHVERPLNRVLFERSADMAVFAGRTLRVAMSDADLLEVEDV